MDAHWICGHISASASFKQAGVCKQKGKDRPRPQDQRAKAIHRALQQHSCKQHNGRKDKGRQSQGTRPKIRPHQLHPAPRAPTSSGAPEDLRAGGTQPNPPPSLASRNMQYTTHFLKFLCCIPEGPLLFINQLRPRQCWHFEPSRMRIPVRAFHMSSRYNPRLYPGKEEEREPKLFHKENSNPTQPHLPFGRGERGSLHLRRRI